MTNLKMLLVLLPLILTALPSCAPLFTHPTMEQDPKMRQDALIGKIIDAQKKSPIDLDMLVERVLNVDVIYLSEKHDNPAHHAFQEKFIQMLIEKGKHPLIAFEFFSMNETPQILSFLDTAGIKHTPEQETFIEQHLRKRLGWDAQSDTWWNFYFRLLDLARKNKIKAAGIDLPDALTKRITRKGMDGLLAVEKQMLTPTGLDNPAYETYMKEIFRAVHCGMGHERMESRLYGAWVARNDKMAHSLASLAKMHDGPVVVIIGNGHTSHRLGVVDRVNAIDAKISQVNIALTEIAVEPQPLDYYLEPLDLEGFKAVPAGEFFYFSQRVSYKNPCDKFKAPH